MKKTPDTAIRAKWMLGVVAAGLFISGITVWPAIFELKTLVNLIWGDKGGTDGLHQFILQAIIGIEETKARYPFLLYAGDWLA